jgi:DNA-binding response OmpR family regulator
MAARPRILVLETDQSLRSLYRQVLGDEGYCVADDSNPWMALVTLPPLAPALAMTGVRLSGMPGWQFVEQVQLCYPFQVPVLYMTALLPADIEEHVTLDTTIYSCGESPSAWRSCWPQWLR